MAGFAVERVLGTGILQDGRAPGFWITQTGGTTTLLVESQGGQSLAEFNLQGGQLSAAGSDAVGTDLVGWSAAGQTWAVREETLDRLEPGEGASVYLNNQGQPAMSALLMPLDLAGGRVYIAALPGAAGLYTLTPDAEGQLDSSHFRGDTGGTYAGAPAAIAGLEVAGTTYVALASGGADQGLTLYRVSDSGQLTATDSLGAAEGIGIYNPTALAVAEVGGSTLVILGAAGSGSLSVFEVAPGGTLELRSHLLDDLGTRFAGLTVLETAEVAGHDYLVAGGADDGLSLFLILPNGQLVHLDTIADGVDSTLMNVSALDLAVEGNVLHVFAASQSETGLTHLTVEIDPAGTVLIGTGAAETLTGTAGEDVLFDGAGSDRLIGGAGADVFVLAADDQTDRITDFTPGTDRVDLSGWGAIYTLDQVDINPLDNGAAIRFGDELLILETANGQTLTLEDFLATDMLGLAPGTSPGSGGTTGGDTGGSGDDDDDDDDGGDTGGGDTDDGEDDGDTGDTGGDTGGNTGGPITGTAGHDQLSGTTGADTISGMAGNDTLMGGEHNDMLDGGSGHDRIDGGAGHDEIHGWTGNDTLTGGTGADTLLGDTGNDQINGESAFDELRGGDGHDHLTGGTGADTLYGDGGNDTLYGNTGVDLLYGGDGNDWMSPGDGADAAHGGAGDDYIIGRTGWDTLYGNAGDDTLYGSDGQDRLFGGDGADFLSGGYGWDHIEGGVGDDSLYGNIGADTLLGGSGNDLLSGASGDDWLSGGAGDDSLYGNQGVDRLDGGAGDDELRGGTLSDTFVFAEGFGRDTITDFEDFQDVLQFDADLTDAETAADLLDAHARQVPGGIKIDFGDGDLLFLEGLSSIAALEDNILLV